MKYSNLIFFHFILNLIFPTYSYTQKVKLKCIEINLQAGTSNITKHTVLEDRYFQVYSPSISLNTYFSLFKSIQLSSGITIERKGGSPNNKYLELLGEYPNYYLSSDIVLSRNLNSFGYISLPILVKFPFEINNYFSVYISGGFYQSLLLAQVFTFKNNHSDKILVPLVDSQNETYKKYDFGYVLGLGVIFSINTNYSIKLGLEHQKGLSNFINTPEINAYHQRKYAGIGLLYSL